MNWDEFESIIDSTTIGLYSSEWHELEKAFNKWKENNELILSDDPYYGDE
jgi:hypothetical protein